MGDVVHALPAVASLKNSFPAARLWWLVARRWAPLLEGNPFVDELVIFERGSPRQLLSLWRRLRALRFDLAVDLQGLLKSASLGWLAGATRFYGLDAAEVREWPAAWFYTDRVRTSARHVVERNLELAAAAGATRQLRVFPLPQGSPEGVLPERAYVLASPLAGWAHKQWPLEYYPELARLLRQRLNLPLVVCGPPGSRPVLEALPCVSVLIAGLEGLIYATRRAAAVVGIDSGPLHLAAALGKPGVAVFGPTDPARNGPYGGNFTVLRDPRAETTYRRKSGVAPSMRAVSPEAVYQALVERLQESSGAFPG